MADTFDAAAARRIGDAVREVESRSAAEIVVEIRARSGSYAHAGARFAAALVLLSLIVLVFMPLTVPPITVLLDAVAVYALGIAIAKHSDGIRRLFTTRRERREAVQTQAAALFHHRGIANTAGETGVLLYVSLLEQRIEVLADRGLLRKVAATDWNAATTSGARLRRAPDPDSVIAAVRSLGVILERDLPAGDANADELASAPQIQLA